MPCAGGFNISHALEETYVVSLLFVERQEFLNVEECIVVDLDYIVEFKIATAETEKPVDLLREIVLQLGQNPRDKSKPELYQLLDRAINANYEKKRHTVILVDEAQLAVDPLTLEEIRLLLNYQKDNQFLLTLILMGQPEVQKQIDESPQLKQRLSLRYHLGPLSEEDARAYILHRLKVAGRVEPVFREASLKEIYQASGGTPREINNLCDLALLIGYGEKKPLIDELIIRKVIEDMDPGKQAVKR